MTEVRPEVVQERNKSQYYYLSHRLGSCEGLFRYCISQRIRQALKDDSEELCALLRSACAMVLSSVFEPSDTDIVVLDPDKVILET